MRNDWTDRQQNILQGTWMEHKAELSLDEFIDLMMSNTQGFDPTYEGSNKQPQFFCPAHEGIAQCYFVKSSNRWYIKL